MTFDINELKFYFKHLIDAASVRAMPKSHPTHIIKLEEARDIVDQLEDPKLEEIILNMTPEQIIQSYPLLAASIGIDGNSLAEVAKNVHKKAMNDRASIVRIERDRQTAKKSIESCKTKQECEAAYLAHIGRSRANAQ
jgi:hypothetical protein